MSPLQILCIQLALMLVSYQVLANPVVSEAAEAMEVSNRQMLPSSGFSFDNMDEYVSNGDAYETLRRHILNKLSKRRAQAKANLAGLWGVPTRFA